MNITLTELLSEINENKLKIIGIVLFLGISIYSIYLASTDPKALLSRTYIYGIGAVIPLLLGFFLLIGGKITKETLYPIIGILSFIVIIYVYLTTDISKSTIVSYLINICVFLIILIGLMLVQNLLSNNLKRSQGWGGFIQNFMFYIPCLANDFIGYVLSDYYSTPQIFFTLFIIEIILVLIFIYAMPAIKSYIKGDGVQIQGDPVFLNEFTGLDSGKVKAMTTNTMTVEIDKDGNKIFNPYGDNSLTNIRANFSISLWVFINPPNTSRIPIDSESNIFYYGSNSYIDNSINSLPSSTSFHPQLTYAIDSNLNGYYKIYIDSHNTDNLNNTAMITIDTDTMPYQKWNNIVFTYNKNIVDIFINGHLVRSKPLSINPSFSNYDIMGIGTDASSFYKTTYKNNDPEINGATPQPTTKGVLDTINRNGLYGSVCNVMYYPTPLNRGQIATNYNYLVVKNIPIF